MSRDRNPPGRHSPPIHSRTALVGELLKNPVYGFLFLVVLVGESALLVLISRSETGTERLLFAAGFLMVIIISVAAFVIERRYRFGIESMHTSTSVAQASLSATPVQESLTHSEPDIHVAPDGTFLYSKPPAGWEIGFTTFAERAEKELGQQHLGSLNSGFSPFRTGDLAVFENLREYCIQYVPGETLINGRPAIGVLDERYHCEVMMFSVSKHGSLMLNVSPEHLFVQLMMGMLGAGLKFIEVGEIPSLGNARKSFSAVATKAIENVIIAGEPSRLIDLTLQLSVAEHKNFLYVIQTSMLSGVPKSESISHDIEQIVSSFRVASAANSRDREKTDRQLADADYQSLMEQLGPQLLMMKANAIVHTMKTEGGAPRVSGEAIRDLQTLEKYAITFDGIFPKEVVAIIEEVRDAAEQASEGKPEALASIIASLE